MPEFSAFIHAALRAAHEAGGIQRRLFGRPTRVEFKGLHDPVTEADRTSESAIVAVLRGAFPDHAVIGEEGGRQGDGPYTWLVDPLDGTHNYATGIPWFAISIGLQHRGRIIAAVILNSMFGEAYAAERGRGAYAARVDAWPDDPGAWAHASFWRPIRVSAVRDLGHATLSTGFPPQVVEPRLNLDHFTNLLGVVPRIRSIGSAALSLTAVAAGQMEGYWEIGPKAWDFAAGSLLVEEAGGRVSDLRGRPIETLGGQILATNGAVHDEMVAVLAQGRSGMA